MGDWNCGNCGEPWHEYHVRHEMKAKYRNMMKRGIGCPACKGEPVYDCELEDPETDCPHLDIPRKYWCKYEGECDHKVRRIIDSLEALRSQLANSDEDPLEIINRMLRL